MIIMNKLNKLLNRCKCEVHILINPHKNCYQTIDEYLHDNEYFLDDIDTEIYSKIIETGTFITLHFYPDTPVGSYIINHYDLELVVDIALEIMHLN